MLHLVGVVGDVGGVGGGGEDFGDEAGAADFSYQVAVVEDLREGDGVHGLPGVELADDDVVEERVGFDAEVLGGEALHGGGDGEVGGLHHAGEGAAFHVHGTGQSAGGVVEGAGVGGLFLAGALQARAFAVGITGAGAGGGFV